MKELNENTIKCECGENTFIYGENFHFTEDDIMCDCGNIEFNLNFHENHKYKIITNCYCTNCKNTIVIENYKDFD
jgi:hypothetical protein